MPSLLKYIEKEGKIPTHLAFSLAALMAFYTGSEIREGALIGKRGEEEYKIMDDAEVLSFFAENSGKDADILTKAFLSNEAFFGQDLTKEEGLCETVGAYLSDIRKLGMREAIRKNM